MADAKLQQDIFTVVNEAKTHGQLKKGANEVTKSLNRGTCSLVVLAGDTEPLAIILHLPLLCEDKNVPYIYISSRSDLGRQCDLSRNVVACGITTNPDSPISKRVDDLKSKIELRMI